MSFPSRALSPPTSPRPSSPSSSSSPSSIFPAPIFPPFPASSSSSGPSAPSSSSSRLRHLRAPFSLLSIPRQQQHQPSDYFDDDLIAPAVLRSRSVASSSSSALPPPPRALSSPPRRPRPVSPQAAPSVLRESAALQDILRCFICFGQVTEARLCPACSKMCCRGCITKWLTERKEQCPYCRAHLRVDMLVNCRFMEDLYEELHRLEQSKASEPPSPKESPVPEAPKKLELGMCEEHDTPLRYFCSTCEVAVCSDCAMFTSAHKDHSFDKLEEVYKRHVASLETEALAIARRLGDLESLTSTIDDNVRLVKMRKESRVNELHAAIEDLEEELSEQLHEKLLALFAQRNRIKKESELLESLLEELSVQLHPASPVSSPGGAAGSPSGSWTPTQLIAKSPDLVKVLRQVHTKPVSEFYDEAQASAAAMGAARFQSVLVPEFSSGVFVLKGFPTYVAARGRSARSGSAADGSDAQSSDDAEDDEDDGVVLYSEPLIVNGLAWRLKVYPNGNGIARGHFVSVFLELSSGFTGSAKYQYRVEMLGRRQVAKAIERAKARDAPFQLSDRDFQDDADVGLFDSADEADTGVVSSSDDELDSARRSSRRRRRRSQRRSSASPAVPVVSREFASHFEIGECWGYNRFYRIDSLEEQGFVHAELGDALVFRFFVRPPTYYHLSVDQRNYIRFLESANVDRLRSVHEMRATLAMSGAPPVSAAVELDEDEAKAAELTDTGEAEAPEEEDEDDEEDDDEELAFVEVQHNPPALSEAAREERVALVAAAAAAVASRCREDDSSGARTKSISPAATLDLDLDLDSDEFVSSLFHLMNYDTDTLSVLSADNNSGSAAAHKEDGSLHGRTLPLAPPAADKDNEEDEDEDEPTPRSRLKLSTS